MVDGRALAEKRIQELMRERAQFGPLELSLVVMHEDRVTRSFLKIKSRVAERLGVTVSYPSSVAEARGDGIVLQLPLPGGTDIDAARNAIPLEKDVDVLSDTAFRAFSEGRFPPPPVPRAMEYVLRMHQVDPAGKRVAIVGQGRLVGKPAAVLFERLGATVFSVAKGDDIAAVTESADIVVLGAGEPGLLTPDIIRTGAIILDAGTSESNGAVVGDADPRCAEKASIYTPVPGGIGPIAVVEIFANLFELARRL